MDAVVTNILKLAIREKMFFGWLAKSVTYWSVWCLRFAVWPVTFLGTLRHRGTVPPVTDNLLLLSATELARRIRSRQVTCVEVIKSYIARAQEVNPYVNAVVQDRFQDALEEARQVDLLLESDQLDEMELEKTRPLLGVPLTVKESIAVKGMSNNGAFSLVPAHTAGEDADMVVLLKRAGAIPLLVSNTPELCMNLETTNPRFGTTNNPYDTRRTPAGSSGGEAALLGSAASVVGIGSDICGSLRLPAMFCGVFGHKPTPGYVSNKGHMPSTSDESWGNFFTMGPMCRYAEDLPLMLHTLVGDPQKALELRLKEEVDLTKLRVFYMEDDGPDWVFSDSVNPEIQTAMRRAVAHLHSKYGVPVQKACIEGLSDILTYGSFIMARMSGVPNVFQKTEETPDEWNGVLSTFGKRVVGKSSASFFCLMYGPFKALVNRVSQQDFDILLQKKKTLMNKFKELLGDDGVFLYPTFTEPAHFHGQIYYKILNIGYLSVFNLLELPATAVPLGLNSDGLPMGIQVSSWQKQDRLTLAVARALEQEFGGWVPPSEATAVNNQKA